MWVFTSGAGATRREQVTVSQASSYNQLRPTTGKPHTMCLRPPRPEMFHDTRLS